MTSIMVVLSLYPQNMSVLYVEAEEKVKEKYYKIIADHSGKVLTICTKIFRRGVGGIK